MLTKMPLQAFKQQLGKWEDLTQVLVALQAYQQNNMPFLTFTLLKDLTKVINKLWGQPKFHWSNLK